MSLARMTDRSLPLAERVRMALLDPQSIGASATAHRGELVADVAAADRLARAVVRHEAPNQHGQTFVDSVNEWSFALAAYRARMAQGVGDA